jgi:FkbM family methyltransferase
MKQTLKNWINKRFYFYSKDVYEFHKISFSQEGEDRILKHLFQGKKDGFYVEIGAHHPQRYSNSQLFYLNGWKGINVDAMPGSMKEFRKKRPSDINIETAISDKNEELAFYILEEKGMNTADKEIAELRDTASPFRIENETKVKAITLADLFNSNLPENTEIDFISIDIEGYDLKALQSNDWDKYRPRYVLVEDYKKDIEACLSGEIHHFLKSVDYIFVCRTYNTSFYFKAK